jgi:hypothetical protein
MRRMDERMNRQFIFLSNGMEWNGMEQDRTGQEKILHNSTSTGCMNSIYIYV